MKYAIKKIITGSRPLLRLLGHIGADMPRVLVYHRFDRPGSQNPHRVSADEFAWQLDMIRRDFKVISLAECLDYFSAKGVWPNKTVVLTIDDGYRDVYQWAYPELLKRKMPATFFITTRFIDGDIWLWPDRLDYAIKNTAHKNITISVGNAFYNYSLQDDLEKLAAWKGFSDHCIGVDDIERQGFIKTVEDTLEVDLPGSPSPEYEASNWDEIREMHQNGIEIGAHTTNHPILSRIDPALLDSEINISKLMIEQKLGETVKSFCYPNSAPDDINDAVVSTVKRAGFSAAVFGTDLSSWDPYKIPRMGVTNDRTDFLWKIQGIEYAILMINKRVYKLDRDRE